MRDLVDIFEENEKNFYRNDFKKRIVEEKKRKKEEEKEDKRYYLDILDGALESAMFV